MKEERRVLRRDRGGAPCIFAEDVLAGWLRIVSQSRPWCDMYRDDLTGELRSVLEELLHPAADLDSVARWARLRAVARSHGRFRRLQKCPGQVVSEDVATLEEAICCVLLRRGASRARVTTLLDALVADLRSIERAAYSGFVD